MKNIFINLSLIILATASLTGKPPEGALNIATADKHPYVDHKQGREGFRFTDRSANEYRVYDFYQRQADYYMKSKAELPEVLPSYPGLDEGKHGHWGKKNQNNHIDSRWNEMGKYGLIGQQIDTIAPDGYSIIIDADQKLYAAFSAKANLSFFRFWKDEFVKIDGYRWGTSRGASPKGKMVAAFSKSSMKIKHSKDKINPKSAGWRVLKKDQEYRGMHDTDIGPIYSYKIKGVALLDNVSSLSDGVFHRVIESQGKLLKNEVALSEIAKSKLIREGDNLWSIKKKGGKSSLYFGLVSTENNSSLKAESGMVVLTIEALSENQQVHILLGESKDAVIKAISKVSKQPVKLLVKSLDKRRLKWAKTYKVNGTLGKNDKAYVVDDIPIPFENKNKSLMFLTDIAFDKKGDALISTLMGEVWRVSGLDGNLEQITWKRIARGLNQPFGLKIWDGKIHVLERDQITYLEDRNDDGEIDFYGNFCNLFSGLEGSHTHTWGMGKDKEGYIHFVAEWSSYRVSPDGKKIEEMTRGLRNCMGFGSLSDGTILVAPQEGTSTPASAIIEVRKGDNHGFKNKDKLSIPLAYVPRGIDNSTGGFLEVDSEQWGPLGKKSVLGICYGYGSWYQVLFDENQHATGHKQAATVPMSGDFLSGVTRGAVNPVDGQVYLVGLDGWGDYAVNDGCLHRLRYTGKPLYEPTGYEVHDNGIKVSFAEELDAEYISDNSKYFAQMWEYNHSRQYGSPEFSIKSPDSLGHDPLPISSAHLLEDKRSIFVEIPTLQPAMQVHLRMHLKSKLGVEFKSDLFPTIVKLGKYHSFSGAKPKADKTREFNLRSDRSSSKKQVKVTVSGNVDEHAKKIKIQTILGLKYNIKEIRVKAGESVALELKNMDAMPHNLVIVKPGKAKEVGEAAFGMMNDPNALKKSYVPDDKSNVIAYTSVVDPKLLHISYFIAPKEKGEYPYICTFPGHWQVMQGIMIVE